MEETIDYRLVLFTGQEIVVQICKDCNKQPNEQNINSVCPFFLKTAFLLLLDVPINLCGLFWIFVHPIKIQYWAQHNIFLKYCQRQIGLFDLKFGFMLKLATLRMRKVNKKWPFPHYRDGGSVSDKVTHRAVLDSYIGDKGNLTLLTYTNFIYIVYIVLYVLYIKTLFFYKASLRRSGNKSRAA